MDLRWELVEAEGVNDPQGALFDDVVERHVGRGEYRGMEFLHVNARRIINEVPAASRMPFRFTINAYRGCSHACTYCVVGETRVLMADGRARAIADVRAGDELIGTEHVGNYRRYVTTQVLAHWETMKPAFRIELDDGTELISSGDHRFLTDRGWKHVTDAEQGAFRRPHLTPLDSLMGIGPFPEPHRETAEYRRGYLCGMIRGDGTIGHYDYTRSNGRPWTYHGFRLALADQEPLARTQAFLHAAGVPTSQRVFAAGTARRREINAITVQSRPLVELIEALIAWPRSPSDDWLRGFLGGIYDAEGHLGEVVRISNADEAILAWTSEALGRLGFKSVVEKPHANGVRNVRLRGGLAETVRFTLMVDPATTRKRSIQGRAMKGAGARRVASIEPLGVDLPMFDITTGTGDFIAEGVVSHNCFARPTHEYLGMNIGDDFDRRIVVKVNAVERLRAELAPSRWARHHIAMGTNTDPYQRCEGKYRLTQGIVRELAAAKNPFSILTKSTLILRDLDLLAEAATVTEVRANFSIGTLDEEVWKLTEPGTPHPRQRVEAVAKLNAAGVPCGVLVAPILPGLSDRDEQLEAVVRACVEAGAVSVTPLLLHLRPGVREHFLGWLAGARPDLVDQYAELYPKAYAPKSTQQALARRVARIVARHGGLSAAPTETRIKQPPAAPAKRRQPPAQLALEL